MGVCLSPAKETPLPGRPPLPRRPPHRPPARETPSDFPARETPHQGEPPHQGDPLLRRHPPPGPHPGGEIEGDQIQAHTQGGKFRGIKSRPTPKGKIQGDQDQTPPPTEQLLLRAVRILLECILVFKE